MLKHARGRASRAATRDPAFVSPTGRPTLASLDVLTGGQRPGQRVSELIDFRHVQLVRQRQYQRRTDALSRACMRSARAARLKLCRLHRTCAARTRGLGYVPIVRRALDKGSIVRSEGRWGILTTMPRRAPPSRVVIAASRSGAGSETPLSSDRSKDSSKLSQPRRLSTIRSEDGNVSATRLVPDLFVAPRELSKNFHKGGTTMPDERSPTPSPKKSAPPANTTVSAERPAGTGAGGTPRDPGVSERRAGVRTDSGGMQVPRHTS